ncbi:MAG: glycosyltransferase family 1 protein, partial [Gemmatimonadaceae bacterium]|nr:glycosyltransferase family 1 protein [Gemmatimonadaceae bacterium]
ACTATWALTAAERARLRITWPTTYQWVHAGAFADTVKQAFARLGVLRSVAMPQIHPGIVQLFCELDGRTHIVALDYTDRAERVNQKALDECSLYIKYQYLESGYADSRIIPGGYSVSSPHYYRYYRHFRKRRADDRLIGVLGRFSYKFQGALREKAVRLLSSADDIHFVGAGSRVRYSRFLREVASARLSLDLPGNGPFTFRVPEFLGLGTCLVSPRYATRLHERLVPGVHYVEIADDLSDLLDVCRYYLAHEEERAKIASAGQEFFERYLHCDHMASYYARNMIDRLGD